MRQIKFNYGLPLLLLLTLASCNQEKLGLLNSFEENIAFGRDIVALKDGGCVVGTDNQRLIRFSDTAKQQIVWDIEIKDSEIKAIETDNESIIVLAEKAVTHIDEQNDTSYLRYLKYSKVSLSGEIIWDITDTTNDRTRVKQLVSLGNGAFGIIATSEKISSGTKSESQLIARKIDNTGQVIWEKIIPNLDKSPLSQAINAVRTPDNGVTIVYQTDSKGDEKLSHDMKLLKIDNGGNIAWNKNIKLSTYFEQGILERFYYPKFNISTTSDEDYIILLEENFNHSLALRLNKEGDVLWHKVMEEIYELFAFTDMVTVDDNTFVIIANRSGEQAQKKVDVILIGMDGEGNIKWEFNDPIEKNLDGHSLALGYNNDIYVAGGNFQGSFNYHGLNPVMMRHYKFKSE